MAKIAPFKGIIYRNPKNERIAPPYDVIDESYKEHLKRNDPYNIVRIILPDTYDKAAELLKRWFNEGIVCFDKSCSHYVYTADYRFEGKKKTLKGIISALKIEEFGGSIKPHEKTLKGPKIDRFNLITKTHAIFCPIMGLHNHREKITNYIDEVSLGKPLIDVEFEGIRHRIYKGTSNIPTEELKDETIIIADGHHRYETALMIREHFKKLNQEIEGVNYIPTLLVDALSGGLSLLPIHRLVKTVDDKGKFLKKLGEYFLLEEGLKEDCDFVMYMDGKYTCLRLKPERPKDILKKLDVSIFEEYIYKRVLGLSDEDIKNQKVAGYAHTHDELKNAVDAKKAIAGFLLKPMSYEELVEITKRGLTVPQKSTFFHPKIPSGLVGYHFDSIKGCDSV